MRDLHTEFVYRKVQKPYPWLGFLFRCAFRLICKLQNTEFIYDDDFLKIRKEQMILLCQHKSHRDYIYMYAGLTGYNYHMLCGYQNVFQPIIYTLFKKMGVIAKMLYQPDAHATISLMRAAKLGSSLIIFPEGIQSTSGSVHPINPATLKLLMKLKLPVALMTTQGTYFARTRYSTDLKKGKISVRFSKLFDPEDFTKYSSEELYERLLERFRYNEFTDRKENKIAFHGKKPNIYGLDNIIYKCPRCMEEYRFYTEKDRMRCAGCGFTVSMDAYYDIAPVEGALPFSDIDAWYKWQRKMMAEDIQNDDFIMTSKVAIGRVNTQKLTKNYSLVYYGEGILTLTNKGLTYRGTQDGQSVELFFHPKQVFSLTMSLQYDLDLYYDGTYYNFKLLENEKQVAKWMLAAEEIHNLYDPVWRKVSNEVYNEL